MVASPYPSSAAMLAKVRGMSCERASDSPAALNRSAIYFLRSALPLPSRFGKTYCDCRCGMESKSSRADWTGRAAGLRRRQSQARAHFVDLLPTERARFLPPPLGHRDQPHGHYRRQVRGLMRLQRFSERPHSAGDQQAVLRLGAAGFDAVVGAGSDKGPRFSTQAQIPPSNSTTHAAMPASPVATALPRVLVLEVPAVLPCAIASTIRRTPERVSLSSRRRPSAAPTRTAASLHTIGPMGV